MAFFSVEKREMNHSTFKEAFRLVRDGCREVEDERYWYNVLSFTDLSSLPRTYSISIKPSVHGNGIFAETDIPKDTVITIYPAHHFTRRQANGEHTVYQTNGFPKPREDYSIMDGGRNYLYGCPSQTQHQWFLGHMINDVADITAFHHEKLTQWMIDYALKAKRLTNVKFVKEQDYIYLLTTRDVKAGEEFLTMYGYSYWLTRFGHPNWKEEALWYISSLSPARQQMVRNTLYQAE